MSIADDLNRLEQLRASGSLTEAEFSNAKAKLLEQGAASSAAPELDAISQFRRTRGDRWLGGVCGGLARSTGVESWLWRLAFVLTSCFVGFGVLFYILMWIFVPEESGADHPQSTS